MKSQMRLSDLGKRLRDERSRRNLSLTELAKRSQVSRSMISAIERGAKAATVLVLDRIATALDSSLARLLADQTKSRVMCLSKNQQNVARDPSGWERRILSPVLPGVEFEFMRTTLGPGVDAGVFLPHAHGSREYVAIEKGTLLLTIDGESYTLSAGDSIYYDGDCRHGFANPGRTACVYYLAMDVAGDARGPRHQPASSSRQSGKKASRTKHKRRTR